MDSSNKKARIRKACDSCNVKRTKCDGDHPCGHCIQVKIECTYLRQEKRRGRASEKYPKEIKKRKTRKGLKNKNNLFMESKKPENSLPLSFGDYPTNIPSNNLLVSVPPDFNLGATKYPILNNASAELLKIGIPYNVADDLYEYYFDAHFQPASKVFSVLRRIPMLQSKRPTQSNLLLCILLSSAAQINHRFFAGSNRDYACQSLYKQIQLLLPSSPQEFTLDDFLCVVHLGFFMPWLSYPSDSVYWWKLGYDVSRTLDLTEVNPNESTDVIEEKLRGWWALFIMDKLTSLCFNLPVAITDEETNRFCLPCDENLWNNTDEVVPNPYLPESPRPKLINFKFSPGAISGWPLNICALIGKFTQFRDSTDPQIKGKFKAFLKIALSRSRELVLRLRASLDLSDMKQKHRDNDLIYAKFIISTLTYMVEHDDNRDTFPISDSDPSSRFDDLEGCIQALEELSKIDSNLYKYPFITSFFLFVVGCSLLSTLTDVNSTDQVNISKINRYKYYVRIIVRVSEGVLISFPAEFLKTVTNLLALSVSDCDNLILLTDYIEIFKQNVKKTQDVLKAYSWSADGRGIAV